jgi:SAM-dependent methyltransferase
MIQLWRRVSMHPALRPFTESRVYGKWHRAGRPIPAPPIVKQRILKDALREHGLRTVVETGTFTGETVAALAPLVRRIVSIELDDRMYEAARRRFAGQPHIELLHGDSGRLLPEVLASIKEPALFWLDGHYTGGESARTDVDSPIVAEVAALLQHPVRGHVVLIDDAREFTGRDGYPTIEQLRARILASQPGARVTVADDIIRWQAG